MHITLREFLENRESAIKEQIKTLNDELREVKTAKSAIDGDEPAKVVRRQSSRVTHKDMIVAVLDERPEGGTSDKVIEWVNDKFQVLIPQASMSSQLSKAKSVGAVSLDLETKIWKSAKHTKPPQAPTGSEHTESAEHTVRTRTRPAALGLPGMVPAQNFDSAESEQAEAESANDALGIPNPNKWPSSQ